jgi:hypothetical protein
MPFWTSSFQAGKKNERIIKENLNWQLSMHITPRYIYMRRSCARIEGNCMVGRCTCIHVRVRIVGIDWLNLCTKMIMKYIGAIKV